MGVQAQDLQALIDNVHEVGPEAKGHLAAQKALRTLAAAPIGDLELVLAGIRDDSPLSTNWLRAAAATILDRHVKANGTTPTERLAKFVGNTKNSPASRYAAFELLEDADVKAASVLIPAMMNDPSLDLRRLAVASATEKAVKLIESDRAEAIGQLQSILGSARDVDQIELIAEKMDDLKQSVHLIRHFGFVTKWFLVGPFDHEGVTEFNTAYLPEKEFPPNLAGEYDGKDGKVKWIEYSTDDKFGMVDLNKALDNHKGAIAYAAAKFISKRPADVELRVGCINGNKVWLNGELLTTNEVYHSNIAIDQYVGRGRLNAGENWILVKVAQNEQTEGWAQRWQFQLRVCDALGTSYLPLDAK